VRKAIRVKNGDILQQFLIEAVTLSAVGGVIGLVRSLLLRYGVDDERGVDADRVRSVPGVEGAADWINGRRRRWEQRPGA
jgi:hypothetical protein